MVMPICGQCQKEISIDETVCPYCGYTFVPHLLNDAPEDIDASESEDDAESHEYPSLVELPNYITEHKTYTIEECSVSFRIDDDRDSHGTTTVISGVSEVPILIHGYAILFTQDAILLEIWNDGELNCWLEFDLVTSERRYIRREELTPYLRRYVDNSHIENYLGDIADFFTADALTYCHYYFECDKRHDAQVLHQICQENQDERRRLGIVKGHAEDFFLQNSSETTWRGICFLHHASEICFHTSAYHAQLNAECTLLGHTALSWGGHSQRTLISMVRHYLPLVEFLFKQIPQAAVSHPLFKMLFENLLCHLIFRKISDHLRTAVKNLEQVFAHIQEKDGRDEDIVRAFMRELLCTDLLTKEEHAFVQQQLQESRDTCPIKKIIDTS